MAGFGGALKNISIGFASRTGKKLIHTAGKSDETIMGGEQIPFLESMAEASKSIVDYVGKQKILFINVMNNMSIDCDCVAHPKEVRMEDIGICASLDPVALDQACIDFIYMAPDNRDMVRRIESRKGLTILQHAEEIGLGSREYNLIDLDEDVSLEAKINTEERKQLDESEFGLPSQRKYPLHDKPHVMQAIRMFNYCYKADRPELAKNIIKAIHKHMTPEEIKNINIGNNTFSYFWNKHNEDKDKKEEENKNPNTKSNDDQKSVREKEKEALSKYDENVKDDDAHESFFDDLGNFSSSRLIYNDIFKLHKELSSWEYGMYSADGTVIDHIWDREFINDYKYKSPDEFLKERIGVCWDYTAYEANVFKSLGIPYHTWFIAYDNPREELKPNHTFLTFKINDVWYLFEAAHQETSGIYSSTHEGDLINFCFAKLDERYESNDRGSQFRYQKLYTAYNALNPKLYGLSAKKFVNSLIKISKRISTNKAYTVFKVSRFLNTFNFNNPVLETTNPDIEIGTIAEEGFINDSLRGFTIINEPNILTFRQIFVIYREDEYLNDQYHKSDQIGNYIKAHPLFKSKISDVKFVYLDDLFLPNSSDYKQIQNNINEHIRFILKKKIRGYDKYTKDIEKRLNKGTDTFNLIGIFESNVYQTICDNVLKILNTYVKNNPKHLVMIIGSNIKNDHALNSNLVSQGYPYAMDKMNIVKWLKEVINFIKDKSNNDKRMRDMYNNYGNFNCPFIQKISNKALKSLDLFHISPDPKIKEMKPRIPKTAMYYENHATPRISFASSIKECIYAVSNDTLYNDVIYVYRPIITEDTFGYAPTSIQVPDANDTHEIWILTDVKVRLVGVIKPINDRSGKYELLKGNLVDTLDDYKLGDDDAKPAIEVNAFTAAVIAGGAVAGGATYISKKLQNLADDVNYYDLSDHDIGKYKRIINGIREFNMVLRPAREKVAQQIINLIESMDSEKFKSEIPKLIPPNNAFNEYWKQWQYMKKHKDEKESEAKESYTDISNPKELYHGSNKRLEKLKPFESGHGVKYVYAAPDYNFALCYAGNQWNDLTINQAYYNGRLTLTELEKGAFKKTFSTKGYIHVFDKKNFKPLNFNGIVNKKEYVSTHEEVPKEIIEILDVYEAIRNNKDITLYHYPTLPPWIKDRNEYLAKKRIHFSNLSGFYFYHAVPKSADLSKGLITPQYMYDNGMTELFRKSTDKYRDRIVGGWNIYPNKKSSELTDQEIVDAINKFRRSDKGLSYIYFFKFPPYKELGPKMKAFLDTHDIYRINLDDTNAKKYIKEIFWNNDMSNGDNKPLDEDYYRRISVDEYFKRYDDSSKLNFAALNHIGIRFKDDYCPKSILEKVDTSKVMESYTTAKEGFLDNAWSKLLKFSIEHGHSETGGNNIENQKEKEKLEKDKNYKENFDKYLNDAFDVDKKATENLITPFGTGSSSDVISNFQDMFTANFIGKFTKNLLSVTKEISKLTPMKEALTIGVKVIKKDNDIIISGVNFRRFMIRYGKRIGSKKIFAIFDLEYLESDYALYMRKKISKKNMRVVKLKFNQFFALEVFNIFALLEDAYGDPAYVKICQELLRLTWIGGIKNTSLKPIDLTKLNALNYTPQEYQKEFINNYPTLKSILNLDGYILAFEQGLGKTFTSIALSVCLDKDDVFVLCPKKLMGNWKDEITRYFKKYNDNLSLADEEICIFDTNTKFKPSDKCKYYITNYENAKALLPYVKNNNHMIVIDESHNFRNVDGTKLKDLLKLKEKHNCKDVLLCSGTPIKAIPSEITPSLLLIDPIFDMETAKAFSKAFNISDEIATDILRTRFGYIMYRKDKSSLNLPEKFEKPLYVTIKKPDRYGVVEVKKEVSIRFRELYGEKVSHNLEKKKIFVDYVNKYTNAPPHITKIYMEKIVDPANSQLIVDMHESEKDLVSGYVSKYVFPNVPQEKLKDVKRAHSDYIRMIESAVGSAIGEIIVPRRSEMYIEMWNENKERFINMIEENPKKTVIFSQFKPVVNHIHKDLNDNGIMTVKITGDVKNGYDIIKMFKEDENVEVIIATTQSMGTGQTLTQADQMFFFGPPWRSSDYDQCCDRMHRIGQTTDCHIYNVLLQTEYGNLSTRMNSILTWSQNMFDSYIINALDKQDKEIQKIITESLVDSDNSDADLDISFNALLNEFN